MEKWGKEARAQYRKKVEETFPDKLTFGKMVFIKKRPMRYGENPGYPAAFYQEKNAAGPHMASMEILKEGTKGLGYINVADMDLGQRLVKKLTDLYPKENICVLVKHEMPSGAAKGGRPEEVFEKAWNCDALSNFGSVDVFNFGINVPLAEKIVESPRNVEVVYAPGVEDKALEVLMTRKPLRVVRMTAGLNEPVIDSGWEFKRLAGGLLLQKRFDSRITSPDSVEVVSKRKATREELEAAVFNWNVACFTRSNAVVIGKRDKVHGIGSGQRSRIDSAEDAVKFSRRGYGPEGCVLASDAFMPFPDVVELAAENGITAIIYPLGSIRDREVIDKADELGLAMIVTRKKGEESSERCFLHR